MTGTQQTEASWSHAVAVLIDVFSLRGRGTVCAFAQIQGVIRVGDDMGLPSASVEAWGPVQVWARVQVWGSR